jgi:hypothetical protein
VPEGQHRHARPLRLDQEDDAASHRERPACVLDREAVDDPKGLLALDRLHDAPAQVRAAVGVLEVDERDRDARVVLEVARLAAGRLREEHDVAVLDADPDGDGVRRSVRERRRRVGEVPRLEKLVHVVWKRRHGRTAAPTPRRDIPDALWQDRPMPDPRTRRMTVLAQDTGVRRDDGSILIARVAVPWEDVVAGPTGHRVQIVDYDSTTGTMYEPAHVGDGDQPAGEAEILGDPAFHARNVYALVMATLGRFEYALGRRVSWCFRAHQLKVVPHAFEEMNSFYSREAESLVFGYYRTEERPIYMCLSHDIVVHETTHALLDGLRSRFMAPSSPDQAAFHEGYADIVALLSVFSLTDVLGLLVDRDGAISDGVIPRSAVTAKSLMDSVLLGLADEMDAESGTARVGALRRSVRLEPDVHALDHIEFLEPHRRGEILVAATMRAFVDAWIHRLKGPKATRTDFIEVGRVVEEGANVAATLLTMAIRALDYTPPVHLTFGDFLSALITADREIRSDDSRYGLRAGLRHWFGRYGIAPASGRKNGLWEAPKDSQLVNEGVRFGSLQTDPVEMFRLVWANRPKLNLTPEAYTRIASLRPCIRTSPDDGLPLRETVAECLQYVKIHASELKLYGLVKPTGMPDDTEIELEGGSTLILDDYGRLKYEVHNRLPDPKNEKTIAAAQDRLEYLWEQGHYAKGASFAARLATLHRLRAGDPPAPRSEVW